MSKDTKTLIPEIPGEWTERTCSGHMCKWNDGWHGKPHSNGLPYVELPAPEKSLYADCDICGGKFELTLSYEVSYTTAVIGDRVMA